MKWTVLVFVGALACGSTQPTTTAPAPAPAAPTLDQMVDAMCACKTPACADQVKTQFAGVDKPTDPSPHAAALRDYAKSCESSAREGDEVTLIGKMEDAMCACQDAACVERVQHEYKDFMKRENDRYHGNVKPSPQVMKRAEHMSDCAARAYEASGDTPHHGTGLDHTGGDWHPAPPPGAGDDGETGIPDCDAYLRLFDAYIQCDKIPEATKEATREGIAAQKEAFAELKDAPDDAKQTAAETCRESADALKQAASALGCSL
jgi:hypothetical protein